MTSAHEAAAAPTGAGKTLRLSPETEARIDDLQRRYPLKSGTLMHVLWEIQGEKAWISRDWMEYAALRCGVPFSKVLSVVSFYQMFHQHPPGRHHVQVCRNITCAMLGGEQILSCVERKLGIKHGEKTSDGKFSLEEVECLGGCSWAPVMQVNRTYYENLTPDKALDILSKLE